MSSYGMRVKACGVEVDAALLLVELYKRAPRAAATTYNVKDELKIADARALLEAKYIVRQSQAQDPRLCFSFPGTLYGRQMNVHSDRGGIVHPAQFNQYAGPGKFEEAVQAAVARMRESDGTAEPTPS